MFVFFARSLAAEKYSLGTHVMIYISLILLLFDTVKDRGNCKHSSFKKTMIRVSQGSSEGLQIQCSVVTELFLRLFNSVLFKGDSLYVCLHRFVQPCYC